MDLQLSSSQVPQSELYWCCDIEVADDSLDAVKDGAISTIFIADSTIGTNRSPILSKTIVTKKVGEFQNLVLNKKNALDSILKSNTKGRTSNLGCSKIQIIEL